MKAILAAVLVLAMSWRTPLAAERSPAGPLQGRVSAVLARFPAETPAKKDALCAELLGLGPGAVEDVCARVSSPGKGDDSRARFAVNGLAVHVMRPGAEAERVLFARVLVDALARTQDKTVAAFFLSQLPLVGRQESVRPLEKYLVDEALDGPATAALLAIGGPRSAQAMAKATKGARRRRAASYASVENRCHFSARPSVAVEDEMC